MQTKRIRQMIWAALLVATALSADAPAVAQDVDPTLRLRQAIANDPERPPGIDTALIFTNLGGAPAKVSMHAFASGGSLAGQKDLEVPANGLAYVFASDLDNTPTTSSDVERRFIGKVEARGRGHLAATAVLVGGLVTDLPTIVNVRREPVPSAAAPSAPPAMHVITHMTFPVVAAY